jgi:hypothetical protein
VASCLLATSIPEAVGAVGPAVSRSLRTLRGRHNPSALVRTLLVSGYRYLAGGDQLGHPVACLGGDSACSLVLRGRSGRSDLTHDRGSLGVAMKVGQ